MKKVLALILLSLFAFYGAALTSHVDAAIVFLEGEDGGGTSTDTTAPVMTLTVNKDEFLIGEEDFVYPTCTATDNVTVGVSCHFSTNMINFNEPGIYTLKVYSYDYAGNYSFIYVPITMLISGTYYDAKFFDDYDFRSSYLGTEPVRVGYDNSAEADYCSLLGNPYEKIGTDNRGRFIAEIDWVFGDKMYDYISGDFFFDYIGELFNAHYLMYEIYDVCEKKVFFDTSIYLDSSFEGAALWTRNDIATAEPKSTVYSSYIFPIGSLYPVYTTTIYYDYTATELYISHGALEYTQYMIDTLGYVEFADALEQAIQDPENQLMFKVAIGLCALILVPEYALAQTAKVIVVAFLGDAFLQYFNVKIFDNWIESFYDETYIQTTINHALMYNHGLKLSYTVSGAYTLLLGAPTFLEITEWNPGEGIDRVLDSGEFGTLTFASENTLLQLYGN